MRIEVVDGVQILRLEAGKANAIQPLFLRQLLDLLHEALTRPGALCLIGEQRFFSGGLDLPALLALDRPEVEGFIRTFNEAMLCLFEVERPVVAAINGHAIAGGCVLAMQADVRVMASGTGTIGLNEVQLGIGLPAPVLETLRCQLAPAALHQVALEGRLLAAEEARAIGLVHQVTDPEALLDVAVARARQLGELPPAAFAQIKRTLRAPSLAAARAAAGESERQWVDTLFSPLAQQRLRAAVARLRAR